MARATAMPLAPTTSNFWRPQYTLCRPCREAELYDGAPGDFLASVVTPIYLFLCHEVSTKRNLAVEDRVMYDDVNETFWSRTATAALLPDGLAAVGNGAFAHCASLDAATRSRIQAVNPKAFNPAKCRRVST